jgi:hypothetical protein
VKLIGTLGGLESCVLVFWCFGSGCSHAPVQKCRRCVFWGVCMVITRVNDREMNRVFAKVAKQRRNKYLLNQIMLWDRVCRIEIVTEEREVDVRSDISRISSQSV